MRRPHGTHGCQPGKEIVGSSRAQDRWALREPNPRPSPCKGEAKVLVRALSCKNGVSLSTAEYLGVPSGCYAGVMQRPVVSGDDRRRPEGA